MLSIKHHRHLAGAEFAPGKAGEIHSMVVERPGTLGVFDGEAARQQTVRKLGVLEGGAAEARVERTPSAARSARKHRFIEMLLV